MPKAIHTSHTTSDSILISSQLMHDPVPISHLKVGFLRTHPAPTVRCEALHETDSKMDTCVQEVYWGMLSETIPMRQWEKQDWVEEEGQWQTSSSKGFLWSHRELWSCNGPSEFKLTDYWMWAAPHVGKACLGQGSCLKWRAMPGKGLSCLSSQQKTLPEAGKVSVLVLKGGLGQHIHFKIIIQNSSLPITVMSPDLSFNFLFSNHHLLFFHFIP